MIFSVIILSYAGWAVAGKLNVEREWNYLEYLWDSIDERQAAIESRDYIPENVISIDVDVFKDKMWLTTPKKVGGVPATLSLVSDKSGPGGPLLEPYPDWSWHTRPNCTGMTNVWRVVIDECNRLWVLDSGVVGTQKVCPPSLILFDARTNKLLKRYYIADEPLQSPTVNRSLVALAVETHGLGCRDTWVYMADVSGYALLVWHNNVTWRVSSDVYAPSPDATNFTIAGQSFEFVKGVQGLALSPAGGLLHPQQLFFRPMSSFYQFAVSVDDLHLSNDFPVSYWKSAGKLRSQSVAQAFSRRGVMFFDSVSGMSLKCWNMRRPFTANNLVTVARNDKTLQFVTSIKVKEQSLFPTLQSEDVWVSTNRFQKTRTGTRNINETNFRILKQSVTSLIGLTRCN